MAGEVSHKGRVLSITPEVTTVAIEQHSACSECHAAGLCTLSDVVEKAVEVPTRPFAAYNVGDEVEIVLKASMGFKAVWLAYFIPLVVLLAVILLLAWLGVGDVVAGFSVLGAVGVYYFFLWLFREKLRNEYTFTIK